MRAGFAAALIVAALAPVLHAQCDSPKIEEWLAKLRGAETRETVRLAYAIETPSTPRDAEILVGALRDSDPDVRAYAARLLGELPSAAQTAVSSLIPLLGDTEEPLVRAHAAVALIKHGAAAVPSLLTQLGPGEVRPAEEVWPGGRFLPWSRKRSPADYAAAALISIGAAAAPLIAADLRRNEDPDADRKRTILENIGAEALASLHELSDDGSTELGRWALESALRIAPGNAVSCGIVRDLLAEEKMRDDAMELAASCAFLPKLIDPGARSDAALRKGAIELAAELLIKQRPRWWRHRDPLNWLDRRRDSPMDPSTEAAILRALVRAAETHPDAAAAIVSSAGAWSVENREIESLARRELVPLLRRLLQSAAGELRGGAIGALAGLGHIGLPAVPDITRLLNDDDGEVREAAMHALAQLGAGARAATPDLERILRTAPTDERRVAITTLAHVARPRTVLRWAKPMLRDEETIWAPLEALSILGEAAAPAIPDLLTIPKRRMPRWKLVEALEIIGPPAIPALLELAQSEDAEVRSDAVRAVLAIAPSDDRVIALRRKALHDADPDVVHSVLAGTPSSSSRAEVEEIAQLVLSTDDYGLRHDALHVLARAHAASYAAPALRQRIAIDGNADDETVATLFAVDPSPDLLPALEEALSSEDEDAVWILEDSASRVAVSIAPLLRSDEPDVVRNVLQVLERVGPFPAELSPHLEAALENEDEEIRSHILRVLPRLRSVSSQMRDAILRRLEDDELSVRSAAAIALERIDGADPDLPAARTARNDQFVLDYVEALVRSIVGDDASVSGGAISETITVTSDRSSAYPVFPLPPPRWSAYELIERHLLGRDDDDIAMVHRRLSFVLGDLGYDEQALSVVPGGFALITRIERIHDDGSPYSPPDRWTRSRIPPRTLREYLETLFLERAGRFRLFVFVVTPLKYLGKPSRSMTDDYAEALFYESARALPEEIGALRYAGHSCHVLLYTLEKRPGRTATVLANDPLGLSAHLIAAGILTRLGRR